MIRRALGACALLLSALPAGAQVIGHLPDQSPFADAIGRHSATLQLAWLKTADDPAGVGPTSGLMFLGRYEYDAPGPITLTTRVGFSPSLQRDVKDPLFSGPLRDLGTASEPLLLVDGGVQLSLTGDKTFLGVQPRVHTNVGLVSSLQREFDIGGYRFGPKLALSYGTSARITTGKRFEVHLDLTHMLWRMNYPPSYRTGTGIQEPSILGNGSKNPWTGNLLLSVGITRVWGR